MVDMVDRFTNYWERDVGIQSRLVCWKVI